MHTLSSWNFIVRAVSVLLALQPTPSLCSTGVPNPNTTEIVLGTQKIYGNDSYPVWYRRALHTAAPRARYPGFNSTTTLLPAGTIRREGARTLTSNIIFERDVAMTLRDGTVIYTDIFRPTGNHTVPAIVAWSPYGKEVGSEWLDDISGRDGVLLSEVSDLQKFEGPDPAYWVAQGYAVLNPDVRGTDMSGGNITYWGRQVAEDGYDFVEWAAEQSWCSGKVGFSGNSWLAVSQWFIAAEQPPHLAAIAPWEGLSDVYRENTVRGGIPSPGFLETITTTLPGNNLVEDHPRMALSETLITPYWNDKIARLDKITVPAYIVASYTNTLHTYGSFQAFRNISSENKWLRVHNSSEWPDYYTSTNVADLTLFFDRYLKGINNTWEETPRVRLSILNPGGVDTVGRAASDWPPPGMQPQTLFLQANSTLGKTLSNVTYELSYNSSQTEGITFTYTVPQDMEIIGYLKASLWVEARGSDDMDLLVTVQKLMANGSSYSDTAGGESSATESASQYLRVSKRHVDQSLSAPYEPYLTFDRSEPLASGDIVNIELGLWPIGLHFGEGETLAISITPTAPTSALTDMGFGEAAVPIPANGGTYEPGTNATLMVLGGSSSGPAYVDAQRVETPTNVNNGTHIIHVGGKYNSYLLMPINFTSTPNDVCT